MVEQKGKKKLEWKKKISKALKELGIINENFSGQIIIKVNQGGVRSLNKAETER